MPEGVKIKAEASWYDDDNAEVHYMYRSLTVDISDWDLPHKESAKIPFAVNCRRLLSFYFVEVLEEKINEEVEKSGFSSDATKNLYMIYSKRLTGTLVFSEMDESSNLWSFDLGLFVRK